MLIIFIQLFHFIGSLGISLPGHISYFHSCERAKIMIKFPAITETSNFLKKRFNNRSKHANGFMPIQERDGEKMNEDQNGTP